MKLELLGSFLQQVKDAQGTNAKKDLLKKFLAHEEFRLLMKVSFDPYITFGVNDFPEDESDSYDEGFEFTHFFSFIDEMYQRMVTGNEALNLCRIIHQKSHPNFKPFVKGILSKDLKLGVGIKTLNDLHPELISEYWLGLCDRWKNNRKAEFLKDKLDSVIVELKKDGLRGICEITDNVKLNSRSGIAYENYPHILEEAKTLKELSFPNLGYFDESFVLDGELQDGEFNNTMNSARRIHGRVPTDTMYTVWDILPYDAFMSKRLDGMTLFERKFDLLKLLFKDPDHVIDKLKTYILNKASQNDNLVVLDEVIHTINYGIDMIFELEPYVKHIIPVRFKFAKIENIQQEFEKAHFDLGEEGIIIKDIWSQYKFSSNNTSSSNRGFTWFKYKIQDYANAIGKPHLAETTVTVVRAVQGTKGTKNADRLGALMYQGEIDYQGEMVEITGNVGGGFKDYEREEFWENRDSMPGVQIDIEFQNVTKEQDGTYSLRFPQFKRIRKDL